MVYSWWFILLNSIYIFSGPLSNIYHTKTIFFLVYILEKLHNCMFFDEEIKTSMFFPTLHDTMLHILKKHPDNLQEKVMQYFKQWPNQTV